MAAAMTCRIRSSIVRGILLALTVFSAACATSLQPEAPDAVLESKLAPGLTASGDIVQDKNFYLLTLLQSHPARAAVAADPELIAIGRRSAGALEKAYSGCDGTNRCVIDSLLMSESDMADAAERLAILAARDGPLNEMVREQMRPSGRFAKYAALDDSAMMKMAWLETAAGVNRLYRVYGLGEAPRYPLIDSASYESEAPQYRSLVRAVLETQIDGRRPGDLFFDAWLRVGLDLLVINQRDEAARYEPMNRGVNAPAFVRAASMNWSTVRHVAILVPGAGTLPGETGLSAAGALRVRLAARRYADGMAPFIIVSGGHVHPNKTPFAEAIEMKRELMTRYGVPENAIVVDPHARHTTTNLRNGVRLIHAMGAPEDGAILVTTSRDQSAYIESQVFKRRNDDELGYQPLHVITRLSPHDLVMKQDLLSLHADPRDPLDP